MPFPDNVVCNLVIVVSTKQSFLIILITFLTPHPPTPIFPDPSIRLPLVRFKPTNQQVSPGIREACQAAECREPASHFKHCSEKVEAGQGWQGEDCVEELFHLMHCVDVS
jgi:hypothetical protein